MNLLLIEPEELSDGGEVWLVGRRAEHLLGILRVVVGQRIRAGLVGGGYGEAYVRAVEGQRVLIETHCDTPSPRPSRELVLALPRPKALGRILQAVASFGVRRVDLVNAWRVDASYFESHKLEPRALREQLWLGCEQGRRTHVPEVAVHRLLVPFFREHLGPRLTREPERALVVGHPDAHKDLEEVVRPGPAQPVTLFVGPDGGFVEAELRSVTELGAQLVRLGSAILRTEVAVVALMSQLDLLERLGHAVPGVTELPR